MRLTFRTRNGLENTNSQPTHRMLKKLLISVAVIAMVVALHRVWSPQVAPPKIAETKGLDNDQRRLAMERIRAAVDRKKKADEEAYAAYQREVQLALNRLRSAKNNVPDAVAELTSFKSCFKLCYFMAEDRLNESAESQAYIQDVWRRHFQGPSARSMRGIETARVRFADQLAVNATALRTATLQDFENLRHGADYAWQNFVAKFNQPSATVSAIASKTVVGSVGLAIEGLFVRQTWASAVTVLGHIAKRLGVTAAAAIVAALSDGPLPVGDVVAVVIAIGGSASCAWDIYHAQETLRTELTQSLNGILNEQYTSLRTAANVAGKELVDAQSIANTALVERLLASL